MAYHHEQIGRFYVAMLAVAALMVVAAAVVVGAVGERAPAGFPGFVAALLGIIIVTFCRLNIDVGATELRWSMTFGWPYGRIPIADIAGAEIVPVTFWMGIGIHLTLRGWLWNVALGKGVRIRKRDGIAIVLGTDDPEGLLTAIANVRAADTP
ncbi:MAG TPA: hypothetical protein VFU90_06005 [Candidatus Tumulicola sp.]|nr:hypothetical protein [Candidatus Tumulicola sp.]